MALPVGEVSVVITALICVVQLVTGTATIVTGATPPVSRARTGTEASSENRAKLKGARRLERFKQVCASASASPTITMYLNFSGMTFGFCYSYDSGRSCFGLAQSTLRFLPASRSQSEGKIQTDLEDRIEFIVVHLVFDLLLFSRQIGWIDRPTGIVQGHFRAAGVCHAQFAAERPVFGFVKIETRADRNKRRHRLLFHLHVQVADGGGVIRSAADFNKRAARHRVLRHDALKLIHNQQHSDRDAKRIVRARI